MPDASRLPVCGHPTTDGGNCKSPIGLCEECGSCLAHCAHRADERHAALSKGGKVSTSKRGRPDVYLTRDAALPPPRTVADCAERLGYLAHAVETGALSEKRGDVSRACVRDLKDLLLKDQDKRIHELEQVIDQLKKNRRDGR